MKESKSPRYIDFPGLFCYTYTMTKPIGHAARRELYSRYKYEAIKKRGLRFNLTDKQFYTITSKNCHYCGSPPGRLIYRPPANGGYRYNGIDRIDNTKGYLIDNVLPCCTRCNAFKRTHDYYYFISMCKAIGNNLLYPSEGT